MPKIRRSRSAANVMLVRTKFHMAFVAELDWSCLPSGPMALVELEEPDRVKWMV
jgi:hypothetical protein